MAFPEPDPAAAPFRRPAEPLRVPAEPVASSDRGSQNPCPFSLFLFSLLLAFLFSSALWRLSAASSLPSAPYKYLRSLYHNDEADRRGSFPFLSRPSLLRSPAVGQAESQAPFPFRTPDRGSAESGPDIRTDPMRQGRLGDIRTECLHWGRLRHIRTKYLHRGCLRHIQRPVPPQWNRSHQDFLPESLPCVLTKHFRRNCSLQIQRHRLYLSRLPHIPTEPRPLLPEAPG